MDTRLFIEKSNIIHNKKYSYINTIYIKSTEKVSIICPNHGEFFQSPSHHMSGRGCRKCFDERHSKSFLLNKDNIMSIFKKIHKDKYLYPEFDSFNYTGLKNKIIIICSIHGKFIQDIQSHKNGSGCQLCAGVKQHTNESFIKVVSEIHKNKYDYSLVNYINNNTKIKIICPEHGVFEQTPRGHLKYGCMDCHIRGYNKSNWVEIANKNHKSTLYIIKCLKDKECFIKIGITTRNLGIRFSKNDMPYTYKTVYEINGEPSYIWEKEKELHKIFKPFSYIPEVKFAGFTECFKLDILEYI